jgi:hypothetical protein
MAFVDVFHYNDTIRRELVSLSHDDKELFEFVSNNFDDNYNRVASLVLGGSINTILSDAYKFTNSIDEAWYENKMILTPSEIKEGCRSTSVGDVIQIENDLYIVMSLGFKFFKAIS